MILSNNNNKNHWVIIIFCLDVPECIVPYNVKNYMYKLECVSHLNKKKYWPLGYRCPYIYIHPSDVTSQNQTNVSICLSPQIQF